MAQPPRRHRLNAAGDFYVTDGCCTLCGVPAVTAPELFGGFAADGSAAEGVTQCWVKRQPEAEAELDAMIATMARQELACIRYGGSDPGIVWRLHAIGASSQIDRAGMADGMGRTRGDAARTLVREILADNPHRMLFWTAIAIGATYVIGEVSKTPALVLAGPLVGTVVAWSIAIVVALARRAHVWSMRACVKFVASFFTRDWHLSDYPIRVQMFTAAGESGPASRWVAAIDNGPLVGLGETPTEAREHLATQFDRYKARHPVMPRPGRPWPLELASTERIDAFAEIARDLMPRILGLNYDECFVSDETALWDFHGAPSNDAHLDRIREDYGVDVSDVRDGNLATILERISAGGWPTNRPATPATGYAPRP